MDHSNGTAAASGPTTQIRLRLWAANLPKCLIAQGFRQPDTFARVHSGLQQEHNMTVDGKTVGSGSGWCREDTNTRCHEETSPILGSVEDKTEVVYKSSFPRWTTSFSTQYEYGSHLIFFVDVFSIRGAGSAGSGDSSINEIKDSVRGSIGGFLGGSRRSKLLGRGLFDVQDILGTKNRVKARTLGKGAVLYAQIEQVAPATDSNLPFQSSNLINKADKSRLFTLRLRAASLVHTHSIQQRFVPLSISNPDTYFEISRPSLPTHEISTKIQHYGSSLSWIVVYRSPPVIESISPLWDEAVINLESPYATSTIPNLFEDLNLYPIRITVYKIKKKKCKVIGSFETNVQYLVDASLAVSNNFVNYDDDVSSLSNEINFVPVVDEDDHRTFQLQRPSRGGDPSNEITGFISVVKAHVECSEKFHERSQRCLTQESNLDNQSKAIEIDFMEISHGENTPCLPTTSSLNSLRNARFSDYVESGLDIDFCVAIDFSSSNGDPRVPGTLHYSRDGMTNDYEEAIEAIGATVEKYSTSKSYPAWGFGAKYDDEIRHIFQCGGSPTANNVEGVVKAYRSVFETDLIMSEPTLILPVLRAAEQRAKRLSMASTNTHELNFTILLILTDGMLADIVSAQTFLRKCQHLPLSIVVVGIGRADFTEWHRWSSYSSNERGRLTFVEYRCFQYDPTALSRQALQRVPMDVRDFFVRRNIMP